MNKTLRIILGVVVLVALVAIGLGGTAWADKLEAGNPILASTGFQPQPRLDGTVKGTSKVSPVVPTTGCQSGTLSVGKLTATVPCNAAGQVLTQLPATIANPSGTIMTSTLVEITFPAGVTTTPADITLIYNPALTSGQRVVYWNGSSWETLTPDGSGKYTIEAGEPTPCYIAVIQS